MRENNNETAVSITIPEGRQPSFMDSSPESLVFFIDNGFTESAKRVLANFQGVVLEMAMADQFEIDELTEKVRNQNGELFEKNKQLLKTETKLREYSKNNLENTRLIAWQAKLIDILQNDNANVSEALASEIENANYWRNLAELRSKSIDELIDNANGYRGKISELRCEIRMQKDEISRLNKALAGIKRGYGSLKREVFRLKRHNRGYAKMILEINSRNCDLQAENEAYRNREVSEILDLL